MSFSEKLKIFDNKRKKLAPYGLTCELWRLNVMPKSDRHNEIELNYSPESNITYLFHDCKVTVLSGKLTLFRGLIPHQIVNYEGYSPYFVCTVPFSHFLEWKLPVNFMDKILKGKVTIEPSDQFSQYDEFMLKNWLKDIEQVNNVQLILLEMHARLLRMAKNIQTENDFASLQKHEFSLVEQIAIYIAGNYTNFIQVSDIGRAVDLHPDYANTIFKKTFGCTLHEYVIKECVTHAQRKLVLSDMSITEIAFDCGFNSLSRFNAAFLKLTGCTPRAYRKKYLH